MTLSTPMASKSRGAIDVVHKYTLTSEPGFIASGETPSDSVAMIDIECDAIELRQSIQPICRQLIERCARSGNKNRRGQPCRAAE